MEWINQHALLSSVIGLIIFSVSVWYFLTRTFTGLNFWYSIWKRGRLAKDVTRSSRDSTWTNSEATLCNDFHRYVKVTSEDQFRKRIEYLSKAKDLGRAPLPFWMIGLIIVLVAAEGLGFSYMLGTWMAMEGSADTHTTLMWAIVFVLATILVFITHHAGHQLFQTNRIKSCKQEWRADGQPNQSLRSHNVKLDDAQTIDDHVPTYSQCLNRVDGEGSHFMLIVAIVAIVVIAVTSTWMRYEHLRGQQAQETAPVALSQSAPESGNPFATPEAAGGNELMQTQKNADAKAMSDVNRSERTEGMMAFLMLAFIFIVTQIVGISAGYKWGFAGRESREAYKGSRGFSTFDDYMNFFSPVLHAAEAQLSKLQQEMSEQDVNRSVKTHKSFDDFLAERPEKSGNRASAQTRSSPAVDTPANHSTPVASAQAAPLMPTLDVNQALSHIDSLGDNKDAAKQFIGGLEVGLKQQVMAALKERKSQREEAQKRLSEQESQEIDDLL